MESNLGDHKTRTLTPLMLMIVVWVGEVVAANDSLPIHSVLRSGMSYHLHSVTLQGTVRTLQAGLPTVWEDGSPCEQYDSYRFTLEDQTGSIEVAVRGVCGRPGAVRTVSEGDHVTVLALIHAFQGDGTALWAFLAMAQEIMVLKGP